jgi:flagellar motor protein MotB
MSAPSITRENASYRQGLILGLTMAETLILIVFCLLLGLFTYLQTAQQQRDDAQQKATILATRLEKAQQKYDELAKRTIHSNPEFIINPAILDEFIALAGGTDSAKLDETWRRIVRNEKTFKSMTANGLNFENLTDAQIAQLKQSSTERASMLGSMQKANALDDIVNGVSKKIGRQVSIGELAPLAIAGSKTVGHQWPPIINLSEAGGYSFAVGSAALTSEFRDKIKGPVVARLVEIASQYDVDIIEVVGHTDEQPINPRPSNLDRDLSRVIQGDAPIERLIPGDNAGLGLARAVSVMSVLQGDTRLSKLSILPLSAAQLINVDETLARKQGGADTKERRRIEIRLRKSNTMR